MAILFIMKSLTESCKCFVSHASGRSAWVGAKNGEDIFLNELETDAMCDFLNLLEGFPVRLQALETHCSEDILGQKDPIFDTSNNSKERSMI